MHLISGEIQILKRTIAYRRIIGLRRWRWLVDAGRNAMSWLHNLVILRIYDGHVNVRIFRAAIDSRLWSLDDWKTAEDSLTIECSSILIR